MKKTKMMVIIGVTLPIVMFIAFVSIGIALSKADMGNAIFSDIESMKILKDNVTKVFDPSDDEYLEDLAPKKSYCREVEYNGSRYEVWAYEFSEVRDAASYFEHVTGDKSVDRTRNTRTSSNMLFNTRYVVFNNNCALRIEGGGEKNFFEFKNFLFTNMEDVIWLRRNE